MKFNQSIRLLLLCCFCFIAHSLEQTQEQLVEQSQEQSQKGQYVSQGDLTTIDRYPYMAAIFVNDNYYRASGAIISDTAVLTGIHRIDEYPVSRIQIRAASTYIYSANNIFRPSAFIRHPRYRQQYLPSKDQTIFYYDVAILRLGFGEQFTGPLMQPIPLAYENEPTPVGAWGTFAGWLDDVSLRHEYF